VFSRQWDRWREFRTWQLYHRRQTVSFSEYLDEQRRYFTMRGATKHVARPNFEEDTRQQWEEDYDYGQWQLDGDDDSPDAAFSRYSEAARRLLIDHGFLQPFQLLANPKQQDQWTTFVEYLAFEYSLLNELARIAQKRRKTPQNDGRNYEAAKAAVDQQQCRVDWVRSEISKIEAEQKAGGESGSSSGSKRNRKRELTVDIDGVDVEEPRAKKRRRMDETAKMAAGWSDDSRMTRSKKRKLLADEDVPEPHLEAGKVTDRSGNSQTTRSKKRKLLADEDVPVPHLEAGKVTGRSSNSRTTRSKKCKLLADEDVPEPNLEAGKVAGRSSNSRTTRSKKRKLLADEDVPEPHLEAGKVTGRSSNSRTTRSKKRKLLADEDVPEPHLEAGKVTGRSSNSQTTRSKKCKLLADEDVPEPHLEAGKVTGRSGNSQTTRSKKCKLLADEDVPEPHLEAGKVTGRSSNSQTTRSKKCKLPSDEDTPGSQVKTAEVAGESKGPGSRSRKRGKAFHKQHGSEDPKLRPGTEARDGDSHDSGTSTVTNNSRPHRQAKHGTAALGSRKERLESLRPRVNGKVASVCGLKT
jgi:hypothetical protein